MKRFDSTPAGSVAAGRRKLGWLLLGPAVVMLAGTAWSWTRGSVFAGLLCLTMAVVLFSLWRLANRHEPLYFEIDGDRLRVRLRWQLFHIELRGARARVLTADERRHLEQLVSIGGMVSTSGGYDSHRLGEFDLYAGDLRNAILLESGEDRFVLTPDDPPGFVDAVGRLHAS